MPTKAKKSSKVGWKDCFMEIMKNQFQPMSQVTYWTLFVACSLVVSMSLFMMAVASSYELILQEPEVAINSWLATGFLVF